MRVSDTDSIGSAISRFGDFIAGKLGLNTSSTPANNWLEVNNPTTADSLAEVLISTSATTRKGVVIQGIASQTANILEVQISTGSTRLAVGPSATVINGLVVNTALTIPRQTLSGTGNIGAYSGNVVGFTGTAGGTLTLPGANSNSAGFFYFIADEGGNAGSSNITIAAGSGDTINGAASVTINTNYGGKIIYTNGVHGWFVVSGS